MIKRILSFLFSMRLMGILFFIFVISLAVATFIENDYGVIVSRATVYNAWWFDLLLLIISLNLIGSFFYYKMFRVKKITIIIFHLAFVFMVIGAGVTRYFGDEGSMRIRENESVNKILSYDTYLKIKLSDKENTIINDEKVSFFAGINEKYDDSFKIGDKKITVILKDFIPNAYEKLVETDNGSEILLFKVFSLDGGSKINYLKANTSKNVEGTVVSFGEAEEASINFFVRNDSLFISSIEEIEIVDKDGPKDYPANKQYVFESGKLYKISNGVQISYRGYYASAEIQLQSASAKEARYSDVYNFDISDGDSHHTVSVKGTKGRVGEAATTKINGVDISISYGSKATVLPFSIRLDDFVLDRYAGSNSPSSYESRVTLIDKEAGINESRKIFMNNVLKHKGYRFYQSSYDTDEKGTILSVNNDTGGTVLTYIGYFLMILGMLLSIFNKNSRLHFLAKKVKEMNIEKSAVILLFIGFLTLSASAKSNNEYVSKKHAAKFGAILVQDQQGRIEPMNTLTSEVIRKISRKSSFKGLNADQIFLEIIINPQKWSNTPIIKVGHDKVKEVLNIKGKLACFNDFVTRNGSYKLRNDVEAAYVKKPSERSTFDKEIIKVDERLNIFYTVLRRGFLKLFPEPNNKAQSWYTAEDNIAISGDDSLFVKSVITQYIMALKQSVKSDDYSRTDKFLDDIYDYQIKYGDDILPSQSKINLEIKYNNWNIFLSIAKYYGMIGFILLVLLFVKLLSDKKLRWPILISGFFILLLFVVHIIGIAMRWHISGHAPWSNGYESMIYIGFATMLAGVIFAKNSPITLAATAILTSIILMVAHLSWMDPQITNLVPVLKSYWLTIHVSVITASYGFLALGFLLGFLNLILNLFKTKKNILTLNKKIAELTYVNEMTLIIGLYLLTIGTFLGGIWANESWGRYWGWDPKETWSLITILVYAFVIHMRYIPGFKGKFSFNFASILAYFSVLMTYFGVNYYLSGLHSYAQGDSVPIPSYLYYILSILFIVSFLSYINDKRYR
ncbi:MAG: c-type cytochrome biogenesis protein CcsB, partial [Bacteroidota bacterium]|nr:c-type cytochrome biogenesis protein CcsB [Bacteroidota bacterium]